MQTDECDEAGKQILPAQLRAQNTQVWDRTHPDCQDPGDLSGFLPGEEVGLQLQWCQLPPCWSQQDKELGSCPRCVTVVISNPCNGTGSFIQIFKKGMLTRPLTASRSCTGRVCKEHAGTRLWLQEKKLLGCLLYRGFYTLQDVCCSGKGQVDFTFRLLVASQPQHGRNAERKTDLVLIN